MKFEEQKLVKNTLLLLLGNFSSKLLVFLLVPLYTSAMSTAEYAISDLLTTTINLLYPVATLMISTAVMRFCLEKQKNPGELLNIGIWVELAGICLVALGSRYFFNLSDLQGYRGYFLAGLSGNIFYMLLMEYTKGCEKVALYSFAGVCNTVVLVFCNIIFLLGLGLGIRGYLLAMIFAYWITVAVLFVGCKAWRDLAWPTRIKGRYLKEMLRYSIPLMPSSISWWISTSSDRYIMKIFRGLDELGLYSASYKIPSIMTVITSILISAWEISAVDDFGSERSERFFSEVYGLWVRAYLIVCAGLIFFVKPLAWIMFQKEFFAVWRFVPILLYASIFSGLSAFLWTVFTSAKKTNFVFITTMIGAGANIVLNFAFIPVWGGYGAAIATAASYLVTYFCGLVGANRLINLKADYKSHFLKMGLLLVMVVLSSMDSWLNYPVGAVILLMERKFIMDIIKKVIHAILPRRS